MAQNPRPEAEARGGSSSSDEEEEASSEENEELEQSESESEDKASTPVPNKPSIQTKPETPQSSSSDDSASESDSPPDSIKPIASKPMEEPPAKPRSKPATSAAKSAAAAAKRPAESERNWNREPKRAKKKAVEADKGVDEVVASDSKKQLFQRLWSEDDEIVILKGIIEYKAKKGVNPVADMNGFHEFIKKSVHVDVNKSQLSEKVRRLKKKYKNNESKGNSGKDRTFSKPHEQKTYELSKDIWGGEANGIAVDSTKGNGKARKNQNQNPRVIVALPKVEGIASPERVKEGKKMEVQQPSAGVSRSNWVTRSIVESSFEEQVIRDGWELISGSKKSELEDKWKKLRVEEIELYLKRADLIREQRKLVLEAMKSSGN